MMNTTTWIPFFVFVIVLVVNIDGGASKFAGNCRESERMALLQFKTELIDDDGRFSSWESITNCCQWNGVVCDNRTHHVVALDLLDLGVDFQNSGSESAISTLRPLRAYLDLANNNFSGEIPTTNNWRSCSVSSLHLRNNSFRGEIPRSLMKCSELRILDLGGNEFSGKIPRWLGESMPKLGVLILKSNMFSGSLPTSVCHLTNLQVLDISWNKITGTIPSCMDNFTLLSSGIFSDSWSSMFFSFRNDTKNYNFYDGASVIWKGHEETYIKTLGLLKLIDLSSNELSGVIPHQLTSLIGLVGLNLSGNNLVGVIPKDIDVLRNLNFLDLSKNNLSGTIPPTLSKLSHLGVLDLSFNNLWGRIPWDSHMQTFEASSFFGNPRLCGPPLLSRPCPGDEKPTDGSSDDSEEKLINTGFYMSMVLGLVVAFWVVFWSLFFNKWWNAWSMRICITVADWLYVHTLVNKRRLLKFFDNTS